MKKGWIFKVSTVWFVSGLLYATVAQGQTEPKIQSGDVARGKTLFVKYCTGCHGPQGDGEGYRFLHGPDPANLTSPSTKTKSDADLLKAIHAGKPNMPPWTTRLSENESRDVLVYVRTLAN
jgi:mono/diheme cytochrome c family protein